MDKLEFLTDIFRGFYKSDKNNFENALEALKNNGASLRDSVVTVAKELKLSLADADFIVLNSKIWRDQKDDTEQIRFKIDQILSNM